MKKGRRKFVHDPDCAVIQDRGPGGHSAPPCTCRERQKARKRRITTGGGGSWGDFLASRESIGNGNYRAYTPTRD